MRQTPMTAPTKRPALARSAWLAAIGLAALGLPATAARAEDAPGACAERYHLSLKRIAETEFQAVKAAGRTTPPTPPTADAQAGDPGLPGRLLFPPTSLGKRTQEETAALRIVASLARSKGRAAGGTDEDARWMGERLRVGLADYLTQGPSPYICGGVADYVGTLRGFASRLGMTPIQRDRLLSTQRSVAERAVAEALLLMKPVPLPVAAPADRPAMGPFPELRPAAGLERVDRSIATGSTAASPAADPDLPPLKPAVPETLEAPADLLRAVDRLTAAATTGGFLAATPAPAPASDVSTVPATSDPVLARLAALRPMMLDPRLAADRMVQMKLSAALSAIEALDYLQRAKAQGGDPLALAIDATFEAILKAHASDCTCRD